MYIFIYKYARVLILACLLLHEYECLCIIYSCRYIRVQEKKEEKYNMGLHVFGEGRQRGCGSWLKILFFGTGYFLRLQPPACLGCLQLVKGTAVALLGRRC